MRAIQMTRLRHCSMGQEHFQPNASSSTFTRRFPLQRNMTECHPYANSNCCYRKTVKNARTMNEAYGEGFQWDRCGRMSSQCSRFFVQEACLYECDISAGLYRKCSDAQVAAADSDSTDVCYKNTWQMYKMPIKASYCDAWYASCYRDKFCASTDGNFFECAKLRNFCRLNYSRQSRRMRPHLSFLDGPSPSSLCWEPSLS